MAHAFGLRYDANIDNFRSVPDSCFKSKIKIELDLSKYTRKSEVKKKQPVLIHQNLMKRFIYPV